MSDQKNEAVSLSPCLLVSLSPPQPVMMKLALTCLAHMEQEEALLSATLTCLQQMRSALVAGNLQALTTALESQKHTAQAGEDLRSRRAALRSELAGTLGVPPESATLQMVVDVMVRSKDHATAQTGQRLGRCRERLRKMATDVDQVNCSNATLIWHSMNFLQRLLAEITGATTAPDRYNPAGRRTEASCGSLFEARG